MALPDEELGISYLIVGAGVFGVSTAFHLKRSKPWATVVLVDRYLYPNPSAASFDLNKIIRADYHDIFYMKLALQAMEAWNSDPLYKPFYHETGILFAENVGKGAVFLDNYRRLGQETQAESLDVDEVRQRFPCFQHANWTGVTRAYYNPRSGWGEAVPALGALLQAAIDIGVVYEPTTVAKVCLETAALTGQLLPRCVGIETAEGRVLRADHVILCTGAATAKLLADSAPNDPTLHVGDRLVAAAALSCKVRVDPEKWPLYRDAPVFANLMSHTSGEAIPLTPEGGFIKVNHELSFTHMIYHSASNTHFSSPPDSVKHSCWAEDVPQVLKEEAMKVLRGTYGPYMEDFQPESYRMCWDVVTKNQGWIISPHDACENLYVAAGGSFHAWKFLPILGEYVVAMLDGTLDEESVNRWSWYSIADSAGACESYAPRRDLKDILQTEKVKARV
ncbi:sarcosine oxidase [Microthyrium microscopicum]|uniref:Sarcosine oxidase n=1 Tax=Microthyrium microscopicum TaxID=703497 RepID=A0A6A6TSW7_9PEZI|nr:sarcosine oxidase [Microthyrium microscopicum]